jgi:hypothetical protein
MIIDKKGKNTAYKRWFLPYIILGTTDYRFLIAACAAAKRAIGTRNGEQET